MEKEASLFGPPGATVHTRGLVCGNHFLEGQARKQVTWFDVKQLWRRWRVGHTRALPASVSPPDIMGGHFSEYQAQDKGRGLGWRMSVLGPRGSTHSQAPHGCQAGLALRPVTNPPSLLNKQLRMATS